jgi:sulfatase maturation enzyme AslB (radical SAM superfamily)
MKLLQKAKKLFSRDQKPPTPDFPQSVLLEPTNACNLRCRMCSVWGEGVKKSREVGFIKRELWTKALDEMGSWPVQVNLDIHGAGEPLLHPDFLDILAYAKAKGNITVGFLCNATLLDQKKAETVVRLGTDWVGFSVDGAQKEVFEHYRKGAVLAEVEENIERLIALRKHGKPGIFLNMVTHSEANTELFIQRWKGKADTLQLSLKRPVEREENKRIYLKKPCPLPFQQLVMGWNGYTVLCCEDCWGNYIIGKFPEESLYHIWHSQAMDRARMLHRKCRSGKIPLCTRCDSGLFHEYSEMTVEKTHVRIESHAIRPDYDTLKD